MSRKLNTNALKLWVGSSPSFSLKKNYSSFSLNKTKMWGKTGVHIYWKLFYPLLHSSIFKTTTKIFFFFVNIIAKFNNLVLFSLYFLEEINTSELKYSKRVHGQRGYLLWKATFLRKSTKRAHCRISNCQEFIK